jgi:hypothetical protein
MFYNPLVLRRAAGFDSRIGNQRAIFGDPSTWSSRATTGGVTPDFAIELTYFSTEQLHLFQLWEA